MATLAENIWNLSEIRGMRLDDLALKSNVTRRTIENIRSNRSKPRQYIINDLAEALGVTPEELLNGDFQGIDREKIGQNILKIMQQKKIGISELKRKSGVSKPAIYDAIGNRRKNNIFVLRCIAEALGHTVEELSTEDF